MEKILDLADVFALGNNFNVLHVLPIIVVIGGVVGVFIFGIKKSDGGEQLKKGIITKSVNVIKKKKRTEGGGSPKAPKTTADLAKSKEKKSNQQQVVQLKKTKTLAKEEKVAAPKKLTPAVGAKNQKSSSGGGNIQQKLKKENNVKNANPIQNDGADGEWHTVTTKRQQKKITEQVVTKRDQKSTKPDIKISLPTLPTVKGTYPKLEDVIAAMSSNSNFELNDNKTAETAERPQRKTKSRALRE